MLSEEKIKIMTNLAAFEKNEGKKIFPVNKYFKSDYISSRMFRSFFAYTISFIMCGGLWALYHLEEWMNTMNMDQLLHLGIRAGVVYGIGLLIYFAVSFRVYARNYDFASRGMKVYLAKLKRLDKRYDSAARPGARTKGGRTQ